MLTDLKYAIRSLRHAPRFTATLLLTIALGVGAGMALYSAADALLFRPPNGVRTASQLVDAYTSRFNGSTYGPFSYRDFVDLHAACRPFADFAAYQEGPSSTMRVDGKLTSGEYTEASEDFFAVLGVVPSAGSLALPVTATAFPAPAVISFDLFSSSGGAAVLGRPLIVNGVEYSVTGVTPAGFNGLHIGRSTDVWVPLSARARSNARGDRILKVVGRLHEGVPLKTAQAELQAAAVVLSTRHPDTNRGSQKDPDEFRRFTAVPYSRLESAANPQASLVGSVLISATALALLSACVNVGSLLLARAIARRREFALKLALGAGHGRIARVLMFESVLLTIAGSGLGLIVAYWVASALGAMGSPEEYALLNMRPTTAAAGWAMLAGIALGAAFGAAPAVEATRFSVPRSLHLEATADTRSGGSLRLVILATQVTVSVVLMVGALLLIGGLSSAIHTSYAFDPENTALITVKSAGQYENSVAGAAYQAAVMRRLQRVAGVTAVGGARVLPLARPAREQFLLATGRSNMTETIEAGTNSVSVGYLPALRVHVIEGRYFRLDDDGPGGDAVLVNEAFAQRFLGTGAINRELQDAGGATLRIVGVVRNQLYRALQGLPEPMVYYPLGRGYAPRLHIAARMSGEAQPQIPRLLEELRSLEPAGAVVSATSLDSYLSSVLLEERVAALLVTASGLSGLCLTVLGVHAVGAEEVRRRTREIAIRTALGATKSDIVGLLTRVAFAVIAAGAGVGIGATFVALRIVRWFVFLPRVNGTTIGAATAVVVTVAVVAAMLPAWRALQTNPGAVFRNE